MRLMGDWKEGLRWILIGVGIVVLFLMVDYFFVYIFHIK